MQRYESGGIAVLFVPACWLVSNRVSLRARGLPQGSLPKEKRKK